ncbi:MAG: Hsp33 family molecular chaperone HslO [Rhodobacteraceae bacterium]|nr:Hsp33 family molecular chaperone HslO [Paracoccaceae bacterium]
MVHDVTPDTPSDICQPFLVSGGAFRGRLVRFSAGADAILRRHADPEPVAELLGQALVAGIALSSGLKYDGIFTLQVQGNGPLHTLVTDVTSDGIVRGCAKFDEERLAKALSHGRPGNLLPRLVGAGHLAFTVDQGPDTDRYQGIVELDTSNLADSVHHYFQQSEQVPSALRIAVAPPRPETGGRWRAAAMVLQRMPVEPGDVVLSDDEQEDAWRTAVVLMGSVTDGELISDTVTSEQLIHRLFATIGWSPLPARRYVNGCRCSRERTERILASFPVEELKTFAEDGVVRMTCEFCRTDYGFTEAELEQLGRRDSAAYHAT